MRKREHLRSLAMREQTLAIAVRGDAVDVADGAAGNQDNLQALRLRQHLLRSPDLLRRRRLRV